MNSTEYPTLSIPYFTLPDPNSTPTQLPVVPDKLEEGIIEKACNSHPLLQILCGSVEAVFPKVFKKEIPNALVLTTSAADSHGNFDLNIGPVEIVDQSYRIKVERVRVFQEINQLYNTTYKKVTNYTTLCRAIDEQKEKGHPVDLLIIRGHGEENHVMLDTYDGLFVGDPLPLKSCLQNLSPKATIVLESCSTGGGREYSPNLANFVAHHSPKNVRVFAPTRPITRFSILKKNPIEIEFVNDVDHLDCNTYKIDSTNREKATRYQYWEKWERNAREFPDTEMRVREKDVLQSFQPAPLAFDVESLVSSMQELSLSDEPSVTEASPAVSLDLDLTHPKRAALSMESDLGSNVSARINVVPLHLTASTVSVTAPLSDNFSGSFNLNPARPQNSSVGFSFSQEGVTGGVLIPVTSPEHMQVTVGGTIPGLGSANISLPISDPLRARVNVEVPFTCVGVPLVGKASVSLRHPENAKIGLAVSTFGLDKVLPIGLPSQISILSINCKKVRHKLQSLGHKAGICSNSHKKRRKKQKAAELKAEIELFHASRKAFQERQEEIKQATELHFQKMLEEAVENVDIAYTPILVEEMGSLGRDLHVFLDQLNELQDVLSGLELPNLERDPLRLRVEELVWNEGAWENMFARGGEAIDGLNQIIDLTERLDNFCNEFTPAIEKCLEESERLTQQYDETERAFRQTEATAQALAARQQQIAAWLRNNVPQNVLQEAVANLGAHQ